LGEDLFDGVGDFVLESGGIERKDDGAPAMSGGALFGSSGFGGKAGAKIGERGAGDFEEQVAVDAYGERGETGLAEEFVDRGDLAE